MVRAEAYGIYLILKNKYSTENVLRQLVECETRNRCNKFSASADISWKPPNKIMYWCQRN